MSGRTYVEGKVHVRKSKCETCIFRPGNLMELRSGRVESMIAEATAADSCIPCHSHLGEDVEPVCRGFYDLRASAALRLADALDVIEWTR